MRCAAPACRAMGLPPACCQRARARSPSAAAASPCDDHLHVVHGQVRLVVRIAAARLRGVVGRDVPAAHGQVDAAAVRDVVIDDHELLVMRRADRQVTVEQNLDPLRFAMAEDEARKELAVHRVEDRVVPQQNLDREIRAALQQPFEQLADLDRRAVGGPRVAFQPRAAVQLPAQNEDRALRGEQRRAEGLEIVSRRRRERPRARRARAASRYHPRLAVEPRVRAPHDRRPF